MDSPFHLAVHVLHIVGALGMSGAYAVEAAGLVGLRRSRAAGEARLWLATRRWVLYVGPPSIGLVLLTGVYLTVTDWSWVPWIVAALVALVLLAVIGGVLTGIPMARIAKAVEADSGSFNRASEEIHSSLPVISITTRIAVTVAIVYLMVVKPDVVPSVAAVLGACAIGALGGWAIGRVDDANFRSGSN